MQEIKVNFDSELTETFSYQEGKLRITNYKNNITAVRTDGDAIECNRYYQLEDYELDDTAILAYVFSSLRKITEEQINNTYDLEEVYILLNQIV